LQVLIFSDLLQAAIVQDLLKHWVSTTCFAIKSSDSRLFTSELILMLKGIFQKHTWHLNSSTNLSLTLKPVSILTQFTTIGLLRN